MTSRQATFTTNLIATMAFLVAALAGTWTVNASTLVNSWDAPVVRPVAVSTPSAGEICSSADRCEPLTAHVVPSDGDPVADCLIARGWTGRAGDGQEAIYAPVSEVQACAGVIV